MIVEKLIFIIGPPGLHLYSIIQKAIDQKIHIKFSAFNSGEYLINQKSSLPDRAQIKLNLSRMIDD